MKVEEGRGSSFLETNNEEAIADGKRRHEENGDECLVLVSPTCERELGGPDTEARPMPTSDKV